MASLSPSPWDWETSGSIPWTMPWATAPEDQAQVEARATAASGPGPTRATIIVSITPIVIMPSCAAATGADSPKSVLSSRRARLGSSGAALSGSGFSQDDIGLARGCGRADAGGYRDPPTRAIVRVRAAKEDEE